MLVRRLYANPTLRSSIVRELCVIKGYDAARLQEVLSETAQYNEIWDFCEKCDAKEKSQDGADFSASGEMAIGHDSIYVENFKFRVHAGSNSFSMVCNDSTPSRPLETLVFQFQFYDLNKIANAADVKAKFGALKGLNLHSSVDFGPVRPHTSFPQSQFYHRSGGALPWRAKPAHSAEPYQEHPLLMQYELQNPEFTAEQAYEKGLNLPTEAEQRRGVPQVQAEKQPNPFTYCPTLNQEFRSPRNVAPKFDQVLDKHWDHFLNTENLDSLPYNTDKAVLCAVTSAYAWSGDLRNMADLERAGLNWHDNTMMRLDEALPSWSKGTYDRQLASGLVLSYPTNSSSGTLVDDVCTLDDVPTGSYTDQFGWNNVPKQPPI